MEDRLTTCTGGDAFLRAPINACVYSMVSSTEREEDGGVVDSREMLYRNFFRFSKKILCVSNSLSP